MSREMIASAEGTECVLPPSGGGAPSAGSKRHWSAEEARMRVDDFVAVAVLYGPQITL
ncbi:MAG: hypothetical protein ACR2GX_03340 [Candidatus Dormibacteria bacterium]